MISTPRSTFVVGAEGFVEGVEGFAVSPVPGGDSVAPGAGGGRDSSDFLPSSAGGVVACDAPGGVALSSEGLLFVERGGFGGDLVGSSFFSPQLGKLTKMTPNRRQAYFMAMTPR
jgi:hypothetical protein